MDDERTEDPPSGDEADASKSDDNPEPDPGAGEEKGLGTETGAIGGGEPTEPERTSDEDQD